MRKAKNIVLFFAIGVVVFACANRGNPQGGPKDLDPPVITNIKPKNFSTNFSSNQITIVFDEYVKLKDLKKQLIVSPPMDPMPLIQPLSPSKIITITLNDTLQPNTTYTIKFGQSIVDNNEENPYPYFRYVFSTGASIDSLSVSGIVTDALKPAAEPYVSVMLYEADSTYTDSIVYKQKPRYITNTLDSLTTFKIENIKAGRYKLIALQDKNSNFVFNQKLDKIAFNEGFIEVPNDSANHVLKLFKEEVNFKAFKPKQSGHSRLMFPFEGDYKDMVINVLGNTPKGFKSRITKDKEKDTLYYWYHPKFEVDSTTFTVTNNSKIDTFNYKFKEAEKDSLVVSIKSGARLNFYEDFMVEATTPFTSIDTTKVRIVNKDSLYIPYKAVLDPFLNNYKLIIDKKEDETYQVTILPEAFTDFYDTKNKDTLSATFKTPLKSDFGNLRLQLINPKYPIIAQLLDAKGEVVYERYTTDSPIVDFNDLVPKLYTLRFILDSNKNGRFDTGNFLKGQQPEQVIYPSEPIDEVRASFDFVVPFTFEE